MSPIRGAFVVALLAAASVGATASTPDACRGIEPPGTIEVALAHDGEPAEAIRVDADGPGRCVLAADHGAPLAVSILYRDADGTVVEGPRAAAARPPVSTEVRVRDLTTTSRTLVVDGPTGTEVVERRLGIPMMTVVSVRFPPSWQVQVPDAPGTTVRLTGGRVEVVSAGLLFAPITADERVVSIDAVPGRGRPTISVLTLPLGSSDALGELDGLLDRASAAVIAAFVELAADGTDELADGTRELADGTRELADGTRELADGTRELADGTRELADGTRELADGTGEFADGLGELADAFPEIVDGAESLADGVTELAEIMALLEQAGDGLDAGLAGIAEVIGNLAVGSAGLSDGLDDAAAGAGGLADAVGNIGGLLRDFYQASPPDGLGIDLVGLDEDDPADRRVLDTLEFIDLLEAQLAEDAGDLADALAGLAVGLGDIAAGLAALDANMPDLAAGAGQLAEGLAGVRNGLTAIAGGAHKLADGLDEVDDGIGQLADGAKELADGTDELADGTDELADGTDELADGTTELADGTRELADGTRELADGTEELPDALREIVDLADRAGHRAAELEAMLDAGATAARTMVEDDATLAVVMVAAGNNPPPLPPAGFVAIGALLVAGGIGTARIVRPRLRGKG